MVFLCLCGIFSQSKTVGDENKGAAEALDSLDVRYGIPAKRHLVTTSQLHVGRLRWT